MIKQSKITIGIAICVLMSGCSLIELSGTMTKKTGEAMTDYSQNNTGFIAKMAGFGGKINTAVGSSVENVARKGRDGKLGETKTDQFVTANKEVIGSAINSVKTKPITEIGLTKKAQLRLKELGYYSGRADGKSGKEMARALANYQRYEELPVTMTLDEATVARLGISKD